MAERQDIRGGKMKITRIQLRRLISESMLQPTFFLNSKARDEFLPKIVADPNVHPMIKDLLQSGEESQTNQGVAFLKTMNPEYIKELESYESHQDSIEYHREFEEQRDNLFFIHIKSIVDKYKFDMGMPLQSDDLTVENISKDTTAGSYTDRSKGRRVKRFTHKRLHGAAIYATDKTTLERIARELDSEKGMGGEQAYHGVAGLGQPLLPYINDYYLTAFDSNLKYKKEMHKKGKYELKVFPATPDQRVYKQPTHRELNVSMYEMKITRKQLRKLILKEFKDTGRYDDFDFGAGAGGGQLPPIKPPRRGGGGGGNGEEPKDFRGRSSDPCAFGNPKGDMYYDKVYSTFFPWIETNFPLTEEEKIHNQEIIDRRDENEYINLITEPGKYIEYLAREFPPFTMERVSDNFNEFFELMLTIITEFACHFNIGLLKNDKGSDVDVTAIENLYLYPINAINYFHDDY